ncbi:MAG: hypothetical protein WAX69_18605 [Victivallales bacterium]
MNKKNTRRFVILLLSSMLVISIGYFDYFTGELGFFIFYFIPIILLSWYLGKWTGVIMSVASSICWFLADYYCGVRYSNLAVAVWDSLVVRAGAFIIAAIAIAKLREAMEKERALGVELGTAIGHLKRIKDILPICAVCGKEKEVNCYLGKVEAYIKRHPESGLDCEACPDCIKKNHPDMWEKIRQENGKVSVK